MSSGNKTTTIMKNFAEYIELRNAQNVIVDQLSDKLNSFPKGHGGLVDDTIKQSDDFRSANSAFHREFKKLQEINKEGMKKFKKECYELSMAKRFKK